MRVEVIVLCAYFIGMIAMGLYWNRRAKSSEDFMLGGRSMGPLVTALTLQTTAMSGFMFMGGPSEAYALGYFAIFYAVGDGAGGMINLTVLGRRMRRLSQLLDAISPIEYLEKRYESVPVKVIACIISVFGLSLIAMSGGVDSSVAACLMQQAGYDCTGITMRLTHNETLGQSGYQTCCSEKDIEDAAEVAFALDMPYQVLDFTADFRAQIIEKFIRVYEAGGTPNPCIDCNKYMKFRHLLDWAEEHGMEYVVTGHYARVEQDAATGRWLLKKGLDEGKDQSYVLYNLTQEQLAHIRLPLGALHKTEVRKIAQEHSFINAQKHDSQDICFVPDGDYARFMEQFTGKHYPAGDFLDQSGKVVGTHSGAVRYTLGQRKGLGLALGAPVYVCGKDMQANTVTVGPESELFDRIVYAEDVNWIAIPELTGPLRVTARTRYHQAEQQATVYPAENGFRLEFDQPQRAPTPGQAAVLYQGDVVLGGGTITRVEK